MKIIKQQKFLMFLLTTNTKVGFFNKKGYIIMYSFFLCYILLIELHL